MAFTGLPSEDDDGDGAKKPKKQAVPTPTDANKKTLAAIAKEIQKHLNVPPDLGLDVDPDKLALLFLLKGKAKAYPKNIDQAVPAAAMVIETFDVSEYTKPSESAKVDEEFEQLSSASKVDPFQRYHCEPCDRDMARPNEDGTCLYCHKDGVVDREAK